MFNDVLDRYTGGLLGRVLLEHSALLRRMAEIFRKGLRFIQSSQQALQRAQEDMRFASFFRELEGEIQQDERSFVDFFEQTARGGYANTAPELKARSEEAYAARSLTQDYWTTFNTFGRPTEQYKNALSAAATRGNAQDHEQMMAIMEARSLVSHMKATKELRDQGYSDFDAGPDPVPVQELPRRLAEKRSALLQVLEKLRAEARNGGCL